MSIETPIRPFEPMPSSHRRTSSSALPSVLPAQADFEFDVAIVGLGYVGLPTALGYFDAGSRVLALDISPRRRAAIVSRDVDLVPADADRLPVALASDDFLLSGDPADLARAAAIVVCVPTPVDEHLMPDLSLLKGACETVVEHARVDQLLMLTSTTYVGCTSDLLVAPLAARGLVAGEDVFVAFSAERIDPGNTAFDHDAVPRVVGGATPACEEHAERLLRRYAAAVHPVGSLAAAEMTKLLENTFRAVNIALANEFADICRHLDLDVTTVIDAAATKPYGFMAFQPGPGVGGHCIPCDPHYLLWQLRSKRVDAPLISQAMNEIALRPGRVVERVRDVLSEAGTGLAGARVLVVGVAYKPNVADLRESPALEILEGLREHGADIGYLDRYAPELVLPHGGRLESVADPAAFAPAVVVLHTRHADADLSWIPDDAIVLDATYRGTDLEHRVRL
jgi:UDP-N-acetyl-D-glucosamine dehydrogenase